VHVVATRLDCVHVVATRLDCVHRVATRLDCVHRVATRLDCVHMVVTSAVRHAPPRNWAMTGRPCLTKQLLWRELADDCYLAHASACA